MFLLRSIISRLYGFSTDLSLVPPDMVYDAIVQVASRP